MLKELNNDELMEVNGGLILCTFLIVTIGKVVVGGFNNILGWRHR